MLPKDILKLYGQAETGFVTKLADIADDLVQQHEAREDQRMAKARVRDAMAGRGPFLDALQRELTAAQNEALADSRLPAIAIFDAYCILKDAQRNQPNDRGLKMASLTMQNVWSQDPLGYFTIGEFSQYRQHFADEFPKSAAKKTFDDAVLQTGFQTLNNLPYLTRIASEVVDQDSYEKTIQAHNLAGDSIEQIRARAYIKALAELSLSDEAFETRMPTISDALERAAKRYAQTDDMESAEESEDSADDDDSDNFFGSDEDESDDESESDDDLGEEMATIESPVSGEELVIELGMQEEGPVDGMEPSDDEFDMGEMPGDGGDLPDLEGGETQLVQAQLENGFDEVMDDPSGSEPMDLMGPDPMDDSMGMEEDEETSTFITDPSTGQQLEVTLTPVEEESMDEMSPGSDEIMNEVESDPFSQMTTEGAGGVPGQPMASYAAKRAKGEPTKTEPQGQEEAFSPGHEAQPNAHPQGTLPNTDICSKTSGKMLRLSEKDVRDICASRGINTGTIEQNLLEGRLVVAGQKLAEGVREWGMWVDADDNLVLAKYAANGDVQRVVRRAGLAEFDEVVSNFMALTAAAIAKEERVHNYHVMVSLPAMKGIARRAMSAIWKTSPSAEGELLEDGRLSILIPSARERDFNRISRVLQDTFNARSIEAQVSSPTTPPSANVGPGMAGPVGTPEDSPFMGAPPVQQTPAGQPALPMQAPMQTSAVGSGAQQNFIQQHTNPMKGLASITLSSQLLDEEMPVEEGPGMDEPGLGEPDMGGPVDMDPGMDPGMGAPMPPMDMGMGMGMGGMPGGMMAPPPAPDASQMPLDLSMGQLQPPDQDAVRAAMSTFRNQGMTPLEALKQFVTMFGGILEKYGDESSPSRALAEAAIIREMTEAYQRPSVIPVAAGKKAEMPVPKVNQQPVQQGKKPPKPKSWSEGTMPTPKKPKAQPNAKPQGKKPDSNMKGHGNDNKDMGSFGAGKPPADGQYEGKAKGTKRPSTELGADKSHGQTPFNSKMDALSANCPHTYRSTKKGSVIIQFDSEFGTFDLFRNTDKGVKKISSTPLDNFAEALGDAQRRIFGSEGSIFIDGGDGTLEKV